MERASGILLHPTLLPGRFGIGDFGPEADRFLAWARDAGFSWWQVLPLGPVGTSHSPYDAPSAFAGNSLLVSPERLVEADLLDAAALDDVPDFPRGRVDYDRVGPWKTGLLRRAWRRFGERASSALRDELAAFRADEGQASWLDDWALFAALRARHEGKAWWEWAPAFRDREPEALSRARDAEREEIDFHVFVQWVFARQWRDLRHRAREQGLRILGDVPIYVARDSADVWAHRALFDLDAEGRPRAVAGVPPDDFSDTGQLWGNPLYRWDRLAEDGYRWWIERLRRNLRLYDLVRLDHFRGFAAYWEVPAGETTAVNGRWVPGPGKAFFDALREALGGLPIVAEDLGIITPDVDALRRETGLPGMKVLHFAFDEDDSTHAPHRHEPASVVYTGTHDNDTTAGWYDDLSDDARGRLRRVCDLPENATGQDVARALVGLAFASPAELAVVPIQDVLGLGSEARFNVPAVADGNWAWRLEDFSPLTAAAASRLRRLAERTGRRA